MTHTPTLSHRLEIHARTARGRPLFQILAPTALCGIFNGVVNAGVRYFEFELARLANYVEAKIMT